LPADDNCLPLCDMSSVVRAALFRGLPQLVDRLGGDGAFERPATTLRVPGGLLSAPLPGANRLLRDITLDYLATHFADPGRSATDEVRLLLARALGTSPVTIAAVAGLLNMHPRTLQRRLAAESTTFEAILDDVRREAALRLIIETDLPLAQVTALVGLTEQSALSRAGRRWFGRSPRELRNARYRIPLSS
jgi:AraC-like DNA-binding protein